MKANLIKDVCEFQTKVLCLGFPQKPTPLIEPRKSITLIKLREEISELEEANLLSEQADALVDLIYFALGALHQCGVDTGRVWSAVHRANMTKVRGMTKRGVEEDAAKPLKWKAPDHTWLD